MNRGILGIILGFALSISFMSIYALEVEEFSDTTNIELSSKTDNPSNDKKSKVKDAHKKVTDFMKDQKAIIDKKGKSTKSNFDSLPILGTYTDESTNELVVILDNERIKKPFNQYSPMLDNLIGKNFPVKIMTGKFFEQACNSQLSECKPIVGGIVEGGHDWVGTITIPFADTFGNIGFIMSGHNAIKDIPYTEIYQPEHWNEGDQVGDVISNPDGPRSSDAAFVEILPEIDMQMKIYESPNEFYNVIGTKTSDQIDNGQTIHMTGKVTGETFGSILARDLSIVSDQYTILNDQLVSNYIGEDGDSGGPVYEKLYDVNVPTGDVNFYGIHAGKACFTDFSPTMTQTLNITKATCEGSDFNWFSVFSSWEGIKEDLNLVDFDEICQPPIWGNWIITHDCIMIGDATIDENVSVESPYLLTIPEGVTLDIDFENQNLTVKSGAGVLIKQGGTIT